MINEIEGGKRQRKQIGKEKYRVIGRSASPRLLTEN